MLPSTRLYTCMQQEEALLVSDTSVGYAATIPEPLCPLCLFVQTLGTFACPPRWCARVQASLAQHHTRRRNTCRLERHNKLENRHANPADKSRLVVRVSLPRPYVAAPPNLAVPRRGVDWPRRRPTPDARCEASPNVSHLDPWLGEQSCLAAPRLAIVLCPDARPSNEGDGLVKRHRE